VAIRFFTTLLLSLFFFSPRATAEYALQLTYLEDPQHRLTISEVMEAEDWKPLAGQVARFGHSSSRFWIRIPVPENADPASTLVLLLSSVYPRTAVLYATSGDEVLFRLRNGMAVPLRSREGDYHMAGAFTYRLPAPREPDSILYLAIEGDFPLLIPLILERANVFAARNRTKQLLAGLFFGGLILAFLFNGFLAVALRSRLYLFYSLFVGTITFLYLGHEGLSIQFLWPNASWWALREMHVFGGLSLFFYALFVRNFLESRRSAPRLDRFLLFLVALSSLRALWLIFSPSRQMAMLGELSVVLSNFTILLMAVFALWHGVRSARIFLASSFVFNLAMALFLLQSANLIWIGSFIDYAPHLGTLLEVILLSFALADRIRITNQELRRNIRERMAAEQALERQRNETAQAEKMGALGRMAGGIAHEINNPLAIIQGNASLLKKLGREGEASRQEVEEIAETIEQTSVRISKIMKSMRTLARNTREDPMERCSLPAILADTFALCEDRFREGEVRLDFPHLTSGPILFCRPAEICQVLVNLLNNAFDAVEKEPERWVRVDVTERENRLVIGVTDSGPGIPGDLKDRILDPFFTTKEVGRGTGLGLSISRTIAENHGGLLRLVKSSSHTRFELELPSNWPT
jgi:signal transduction histidine kinase